MKYFKTTILVLFLAMFTFTSCKDESIEIAQNTTKSSAAKSAMKALKTHFNEDGTLKNQNNPTNNIIFDFCFDFVYPITLSYNTGTEVTVQNLEGLVDILINTTDDLYIDGINFPFQVETFNHDTDSFEIVNVQDEATFLSIIEDCSIDEDGGQNDDCDCTDDDSAPVCVELQTPNGETFTMEFPNFCYAQCEGFTQSDIIDCDYTNPSAGNIFGDCFDFIYPISVIYYGGDSNQGTTVSVNNDDELEMVFYTNYSVEFVYPFNVQVEENGQQITQTIENGDEFYNLMLRCNESDECDCTQEYAPVCVTNPNGGDIIEYINQCHAICDGFTPNDFVDCNPVGNDDCQISNLTVQVGDCISETAYSITVNFTVQNSDSDLFTITFGNGTSLNNLSTNDLPISFDLDTNDTGIEYLQIIMDNSQNCAVDADWFTPECTTPPAEGCWSFVYPLTINVRGDNVTVNSDAEFNSIFNPADSNLVYPFDVTIGNETISVITPNNFYEIGEFDNRCD